MGSDNNNKNGLEPVILIVGGFLSIIIIGIVGIAISSMGVFIDLKVIYILMTISVIVMIAGFILNALDSEVEKDKHVANMNQFQKEYDEYVSELGIVKSDDKVTMIQKDNEYSFEDDIPHYLWLENNCINFFPMAKYYKINETSSAGRSDVSKLKIKSIPIDSILYFEEMGELRKYTTVSGGGTSLKGALVGYAIAEDLGAIIGSREPIKASVVSEDDRMVEMLYKNENGEIENLEFTHDAYKVLKKLIPSKELRRIANLKTVKKNKDITEVKTQEPQAAKDKLKQLKEMKKEGLITEDEFLEQKKKILDTF